MKLVAQVIIMFGALLFLFWSNYNSNTYHWQYDFCLLSVATASFWNHKT